MHLARLCPLALALLLAAAPAWGAEDSLAALKNRGALRCGVAHAEPGFAERDQDGRWRGFNVDFCRAVAAAVLGDPDKASFLPLPTTARFTALMAREVDLLAHNTTWTIGREAMLRVEFAWPMLFTGQAFMVRAGDAPGGVAGLQGARVATSKGSTHVQNLEDMAASHGLRFEVAAYDSTQQARDAFFAGECRAISDDAVLLAAFRSRAPGGPQQYVVLPERFSREPIAPAVLRGDGSWGLVVRSVLAALITAEECGLSREEAATGLVPSANPAAALFVKRTDALARPLGLSPGWALRAVAAAGNYGEMFERNLGGPLGLDRAFNKPWNKGGLLFAPPF